MYRNLATRERSGWIGGLTAAQALWCVGASVPVLVAMTASRYAAALLWAVIGALVVVLVVVPVRGRPAFRWLADLTMFEVGVVMGWSPWQSRAAAGLPGRAGEPDLPGVLRRLEFPDGPPFRDDRRPCLIHDTEEGRWAATAQLTHGGVGMLSDEQRDRLASELSSLLTGLSHREVVDRVSLMVRTVPDDGTAYQVWSAAHADPGAHPIVRRNAEEMDRRLAGVSMRTELFVAVSGSEKAMARPAREAGGRRRGGYAYVLYRVLDGVEDALRGMGVQSVTWLTSTGLAQAIRTGFNPAAAGALEYRRLVHDPDGTREQAGQGVPLDEAGPALAPAPAARAYHHDAFSSVTFAVRPPDGGAVFGSLAPLLAVRAAGERRTVAVHYEVLSAAAAERQIGAQRFRTRVVLDTMASRGFNVTAADKLRARSANDQEVAVATGQAMVRYAIVASVTVPAQAGVEDHAARLENDASGRFRLLRLELAQDSAFVAAAIPVGIGLPRLRGVTDR